MGIRNLLEKIKQNIFIVLWKDDYDPPFECIFNIHNSKRAFIFINNRFIKIKNAIEYAISYMFLYIFLL